MDHGATGVDDQKNHGQLHLNFFYKNAKLIPKRLLEKHDKLYKIARKSNYLPIEELSQDWENDEWINVFRDIITYDEQGNITELLTQDWDSEEWIDAGKATFSYDKQGNVVEFTIQLLFESNWIDYNKSIFIYDEQGNITEELSQNKETNEWVNSSRIIRTYANVETYVDDNKSNILESYTLFSNYPNPFNSYTTITFTLPASQGIRKINNIIINNNFRVTACKQIILK